MIRVRILVSSDEPLPDLFAYTDYDEGWIFDSREEAMLWVNGVKSVWPELTEIEFSKV